MDSKEIQELLKLVNRLELAEFKYKQGEVEFSVKTKFYHRGSVDFGTSIGNVPSAMPIAQPTVTSPPPNSTKPNVESEGGGSSATPAASKENLIEIKSPIVGTFYRSSSPDKPAYVKPGDTVDV